MPGKTPSVFVCFTGKSKREPLDQGKPGAIQMDTLNFRDQGHLKNWRGSPSARFGSEIPEEGATRTQAHRTSSGASNGFLRGRRAIRNGAGWRICRGA